MTKFTPEELAALLSGEAVRGLRIVNARISLAPEVPFRVPPARDGGLRSVVTSGGTLEFQERFGWTAHGASASWIRGPWNDYDGPIHAAHRMEGAPIAELAGMLADEIREVSAALAREAGAE